MMQANDTIVITFQELLRSAQRESARGFAERAFPGRKVVILEGGAMVGTVGQAAMLERIETKLDQNNAMLAALLDAIADEGVDEQAFDLDGNPLDSCERDEDQPL